MFYSYRSPGVYVALVDEPGSSAPRRLSIYDKNVFNFAGSMFGIVLFLVEQIRNNMHYSSLNDRDS